jgi:UDP-N-acetyl-D-glucosamine/UDP-N-acetyl-D-galactosamine dehydrogenase
VLKMNEFKIAVIGLGYVGLPVAVALAKRYTVVGFDVSNERISELKNGFDRTAEIETENLLNANIHFVADIKLINDCNFYIIAVPTPIDAHNSPNMKYLESASKMVGGSLDQGDIIVFESTVYPGATEDFCVPILEQESGMLLNTGFSVGYSPERINPGDKLHTFNTITKVVSGSNSEALGLISDVYSSVVEAGVYRAVSIKVAEAAKVIENTQRDLNIAFINELTQLFNKLDISIWDVLSAARTKWNFLDFEPGLVGGHCIGVDPYYLTHQAQKHGHDPSFILAGRSINESMAAFTVQRLLKEMVNLKISLDHPKVLVMGCTFKENCPDIRNSKVFDLITEMKDFNFDIDIYDYFANSSEVQAEYELNIFNVLPIKKYDIILIAVPHLEYINMKDKDFKKLRKEKSFVFDLKNKMHHLSERSLY